MVLFSKFRDVFSHILSFNQYALEKSCDSGHLLLFHSEPCHFLHADAYSRWVENVFKRLEGQEVHVADDVVVLEYPGHFVSAAVLYDINGNLVTLSEPELFGLNVEPGLAKLLSERLGVGNDLGSVGCAEVEHLVGSNGEADERIEMMVRA